MKAAERRSLGLISAAVVWALVVLAGYYYIHKPVTPGEAAALGRALLDVLLGLVWIGLAGGVGRRLLAAQALAPLERMALQAALGAGMLGLIWLLAGLLGLYGPLTAWVLLALGMAALGREVSAWWREVAGVKALWRESGAFGKALALGSGLLAGGQLPFGLAPPLKWDALMYHLQLPRLYLEAGRFAFMPENPYWGHPQLAEMVYTWGMALRGVETATAVGWALMGVVLLGILGSAARYSGPTAGWLAVAALLVGFSFRGMLSWGYADGLAALYGFTELATLLGWLRERKARWLLWVGVFCGFALWAKLTAGLLLPLVLATILLFQPGRLRERVGPAVTVLALAIFVFLPWLLINAFATGNPLYPHLWPTAWTSLERQAYFTGEGASPGAQLLWLPLALTWFGVEAGQIEGVFNYYSDFGPLLLLFAVPGILLPLLPPSLPGLGERGGRGVSEVLKVTAIWLLGGWAAMALGGLYSGLLWQSRVYFVLLPAAALAAGFGWQALQGVAAAGVRLGRVLAALVLLVLGITLVQDTAILVRQNPHGVVLGQVSSEDYLDAGLGWYAPAMRSLQQLPEDAKVLFLWEPRGLYAPANAQADVWIDRWFLERRSTGDPDAILEAWQEAGFTHVLLNRSGAEFERTHRQELTPDDWQALEALLAQLSLAGEYGGAYELYSISP